MLFSDAAPLIEMFRGKSVAIVGSGPGCTENQPGFVDSHDVVVRVNNYATGPGQGFRCDVFYSFFGGSIKKTREELKTDGVKLCICKCPDAKFIESDWHRKNNKPLGTDFRYIYRNRKDWWFCPTYVPAREEFMQCFDMLEQHVPSTGFSALWTISQFEPASIFLSGYDFFSSRIHNVSEPWRPGNPDDPIGHSPEREREWVKAHADRFTFDKTLTRILET